MIAPDDLAAWRRHLGRGLARLRATADDYVRARDYYEGKAAEVHANPAVARRLRASAEAHPLALAHIPVDALLDRVELTGVAASGGADLDALLEETGYLEEAPDWHTKAGYFGDYYVMLDPREVDAENGRALDLDLIGASPLTSVVLYDERTGRVALYGVRVWHEADGGTGGRWRAALFYDDATIHLVTSDAFGPNTQPKATDFSEHLDEDATPGSERVEHEGGVILLQHFPIDGRPYGRPLHRKAYGPQDALTKYSASSLAAVDGAVYPIRVALLEGGAEVDDDDSDFDVNVDASGSGATPQSTTRKPQPGTIELLRGVKSVTTLEGSKPDVFLTSQDWYVRAMAVATGTPIFEFESEGAAPSGEARRRAEVRIVRHARRVVRDLTTAHAQLVEKMLAVRGVDAGVVTVSFAPLETSTDSEGIDLVAKKVANGVPPRVALLEAGYSKDDVDKWLPEADAAALTIDAVVKLAPALAQIGQAVTLGAITEEEARALLPSIFTEARGEGPTVDLSAEPIDARPSATEDAQAIRSKLEALGVGVRAGADPVELAAFLGITGVTFPNVPVTVRIPEGEAASLEGSGAPAPAAPEA